MKLTVSERYNAAVVALKGEFFGLQHGPELQKALANLRESNRVRVVLDVTNTTRLDSSAVGTLIQETEALREAGGDLRFGGVGAQNRVVQLLTVFRLHDFYTWYPTVDEAVASYDAEANEAPTA
jgi:anti-sigma B factor antagonist